MPSVNKTPNYNLNQWQGNEYPKRQDFVDDNNTIDEALTPAADPAEVPEGNGPGKLIQWVGWFANRIKAITGLTNWWDTPIKSLKDLAEDHTAHLNDSVTDANGAHGLIVEDGTFTPVLSFGGASTGITYSRQAGRYRRIGNIVDIEIELKLTSKGTATGSAKITGLPFATPKDLPSTVNLNSTNSFLNWDAANGKNKIVVQLATYTSEIYPKIESINTGNDLLYDTNFNDITIFTINGTYHI